MTNILITGATGFVGANLTHRLVREKQNVHVLVRPHSDMWRIRSVQKKITVHRGDLSDARGIMRAVKRAQPEIVYHVAAHGLFLKQDEPVQMVTSNVLGTVHLLEALRHVATARRIINVGSIAEYDPDEPRVQEHSLLRPANAYGASKASQSFFAHYYARFHNMPIVIVRPSLLYGPYEEPRRLVPASILAHMRKTPLSLASPKPRKDFLFVEDALDAFERAATRDVAPGEIINIGAGKEYSIRDVVSAVQQAVGVRVPLQWGVIEERRWDSMRKHTYDVSKAKKILGWKASHTLEEGLSRTVEWFQKNHTQYPYVT